MSLNEHTIQYQDNAAWKVSWQARDLEVSELDVADRKLTAGKGYTL